ncbi:protein EXORDIUM-like [Chenopodium quinoa]|nr:protein EXORDIUM-like [Chenopodium quinoa]
MSSFLALIIFILATNYFQFSLGVKKLASLYEAQPMPLKYHNGPLLEGQLPVYVLWYGKFSPSQKTIVSDFFLSLDRPARKHDRVVGPTVGLWWHTVQTNYMKKAGKGRLHVILSKQHVDEECSLGKNLNKSQLAELARRVNSKPIGLTLVLTANDVAVEGFCVSSCGSHGSDHKTKSTYIWVGNSISQCPGQCAWPFHQPIYGPQDTPLVAPNADVGVDGMVVNIANLLANTATNPFGTGYYQGEAEAPLEVASACTGVYGKGAYPGHAGELLIDSSSGASYNANGLDGRKYLLPALFDPSTSTCWTLV